MAKHIFLNKSSLDGRVLEIAKLFEKQGIDVFDLNEKMMHPEKDGDSTMVFLEPSLAHTSKIFENISQNSHVFGYAKTLDKQILKEKKIKYTCLADDEEFVRENNYLTALAMREILVKRYKDDKGLQDKKILIVGWGRLCAQLERVLNDVEIHVLNFSKDKMAEIKERYGDKSHFEYVNLCKFDVVINTVPAKVIGEKLLSSLVMRTKCKHLTVMARPIIYDLASRPYGFDWGNFDKEKFDYNIEPSLPGRFYPIKAAELIFKKMMRDEKPTIVLCIAGSSCSYAKLLPIIKRLSQSYNIIPCLSTNASVPNRFVDMVWYKKELVQLTGNQIINTIAGAELLSSNKKIVASLVFPATGNTVAKLANGITDTPVTMAVKALLRNSKPCVLGISTNDGLSGNAENIGRLLNRKNYFFVPYSQDDAISKPFSLVCDFDMVENTLMDALKGNQIQPILLRS